MKIYIRNDDGSLADVGYVSTDGLHLPPSEPESVTSIAQLERSPAGSELRRTVERKLVKHEAGYWHNPADPVSVYTSTEAVAYLKGEQP